MKLGGSPRDKFQVTGKLSFFSEESRDGWFLSCY